MNTTDATDSDDDLGRAGDALQALADGPARQAADAIGESFARAGKRISSELQKAARTGAFSFRGMVESILDDLARLAINKVIGGVLGGTLGKALGGVFSARAEGGPVLPGGAYLVGERGPEVFRPTSAGTIENSGASARVVVNFNLGDGADINSFRRSQGQITALLARAVDQGRRRL